MIRIAIVCLALLLLASSALAASHAKKHLAAVSIPTPGSFVAAAINTSFDETIGVANELDPTVDVVDAGPAWARIPTGAATYQPGYSLTAAAGSNTPGVKAALLPGSQYEVTWDTAAVQGGSTGFSYFDPKTVTFGGVTQLFTNADRNAAFPQVVNGAKLTVNADVGGLTSLVLVLPTGETYMVAGIRF